MARYKSVHTGPQIDSAVGRALPGGEIDLSLSNKADKVPLQEYDLQLASGIASAGVSTFSKDQFGTVRVQFCVKKSDDTAFPLWSNAIASLPVNFRPTGWVYSAACSVLGDPQYPVFVGVANDTVYVFVTQSGSAQTTLAGEIFFQA